MIKIDIKVILETKKNATKKYELKGNKLVFDNTLPKNMKFPQYYGFIPKTLAEDNDALDVVVVSNTKLSLKKPIDCRPIGMLKMTDAGEQDNKIIAVTIDNKLYKNITDLNPKTLEKLQWFFKNYKPENKKVGGFVGSKGAQKHIKMAINAYKK